MMTSAFRRTLRCKTPSHPAPRPGLLSRFARRQEGSISVESALFLTMVSLGAAQMISLKGASNAKSEMADALHVTSQYVVRGGTNIARIEALFEQNYGAAPESLSTSVLCAATPPMNEDGSVDTSEDVIASYRQTGMQTVQHTQKEDGSWGDCNTNFPYRFLDLLATDTAPRMFRQERQTVSARIRVPI